MRFISDTQKVDTKASSQELQVICAGLSRCATSSLQAALEGPVLDFSPCMHMAYVAPHVDRLKLCLAAMEEMENAQKRKAILRKLFTGYAATADFPGILFIDDLMDMYPDAVVILNTRPSAEGWVKSVQDSLDFFYTPFYKYTCLLWETDRLHYEVHHALRRLKLIPRKFNVDTAFATTEFYHAYNAWMRRETKKRGRKLLEWQARDGYAPLCEFLGRPVPLKEAQEDEKKTVVEFPHLNDQRSLVILKAVLVTRGLVSWGLLLGLPWLGWQVGAMSLTWLRT